jgi:hypothetical protein
MLGASPLTDDGDDMAAQATATETSTHIGERSARLSWLVPRSDDVRAGARLLDADRELASVLDPADRARLSPLLRVRIESLDVGEWAAPDFPLTPDSLGLLVLDGLILRDLSVRGRRCAELLGPGDLLRPWLNPSGSDASVAAELTWEAVVGPVRLAILDRRASLLIGRFPALVAELMDRTLSRARALQFQLALTQVHGIGARLELLLWELADRWGRVTPEGVTVPVDLTHEMLGRLVGARRPSVTTALGRLAESGAVVRRSDGWLLCGDPRGAAATAVSAGGAPLEAVDGRW